jgi:hypothetical protein
MATSSLRSALPKKDKALGAATRTPLPPKQSAFPRKASDEQVEVQTAEPSLSETPAPVSAETDVIDLRSSEAEGDVTTIAPEPTPTPKSVAPRTPRPQRATEPTPEPVATLVVPCQLQLSSENDTFLREVEMFGLGKKNRSINRSSAARYALDLLQERMTPQEVGEALLKLIGQDDAAPSKGRGRKRI